MLWRYLCSKMNKQSAIQKMEDYMHMVKLMNNVDEVLKKASKKYQNDVMEVIMKKITIIKAKVHKGSLRDSINQRGKWRARGVYVKYFCHPLFIVQYTLDLRKILGMNQIFLKLRFFLISNRAI